MLSRIYVSSNRHFLVTADGKPFFWLGDTAWELFHRCSRDEVEMYLENRRRKGFNVVQSVVLAEQDGLRVPNTNGDVPLSNMDPTRPNEAYFEFVDFVIDLAAAKGIYIGLLPTWGDKVLRGWGAGPVIFNVETAYTYGRFLGERYRDRANIIWINGGDRVEVENDRDYGPVWRAMAEGVKAGVNGHTLMTYHTIGGRGSSMSFHYDHWLDLNMWQSGHSFRDTANWDMVASDYARIPVKPVLDGEPNYEDHPVGWNLRQKGRFDDYDVRRQAYRPVFAGACGHTYGHQSIWQMYREGHEPASEKPMDWKDALDRPGATQMIHLRRLIESRPYLTRIPDQSVLIGDPGTGPHHVRATRDSDGRYMFVYIPMPNRTVKLVTRVMSGDRLRAWWYDPRTGTAETSGEYPCGDVLSFTTPGLGPDWVLVLDDVAQNFEAPGKVTARDD